MRRLRQSGLPEPKASVLNLLPQVEVARVRENCRDRGLCEIRLPRFVPGRASAVPRNHHPCWEPVAGTTPRYPIVPCQRHRIRKFLTASWVIAMVVLTPIANVACEMRSNAVFHRQPGNRVEVARNGHEACASAGVLAVRKSSQGGQHCSNWRSDRLANRQTHNARSRASNTRQLPTGKLVSSRPLTLNSLIRLIVLSSSSRFKVEEDHDPRLKEPRHQLASITRDNSKC